MRRLVVVMVGILCVVWFGVSGCATRSSIQEQIDESLDKRIGEVEKQVEANQKDLLSFQHKQERALTASSNAKEMSEDALARAEEVGKVAQAKLLYQVTFTDEAVHFGFDSHTLSKQAKQALDSFCNNIKAANKDIYIEIQGHTDSIGTERYNLLLGKARAEMVKRYLHMEHGIPLHRVSSFSYGESRPIADNTTPANRAKNRRVTLVVIQ